MDERTADGTADGGVSGAADTWPLSAREAAQVLGVSERTIRRAIVRGDLPATLHAGVYRIAAADLARYRAPSRVPIAAPARTFTDRPRLIPVPGRVDETVPPLPRPLTALVGREREATLARDLLRRAEVRLLTLTGPGGIGKTRLAIKVAGDVHDAFAGGVRFVPLASVADPERVADAVSRALGIVDVGGRPVQDALVAALAEAETLLVLDNFEHVLPAADLVADLLATCPHLTILVTSRTLLRVSGEQALPVPPLSLPSQEVAGPLLESDAVRLFAERARAVNASFTLTEETAPQVAEICRRLDGLPLAIELAAARVNFLPLTSMRDRLDRRLPLLTGGARDAPPRHQTMRDAIAWSYDLLTDEEQAIFRHLSVFAGGFTLAAAEAVAEGPSSASVLEVVASLVDKSLVRQQGVIDRQPRFGMLETIRAFALEQLEASGEAAAVRHLHADWYLDFVERFGAGDAYMLEDLWWLRPVEVEHDNVRAALAWRERAGDDAGMLRLAVTIQPLWEVRGHHAEAIGWFERGLAVGGDAAPAIRLRAQAALGRHLERQGRYDQARTWFREALALSRELGDPRAMANALHALGGVEVNQEHYELATPLLEESLAIFHQLGDDGGICGAHYFLGIVGYGQGDIAGATAQIEAALEARRTGGPIFNLSVLLNALGLLRCEQGDAENGAEALAESRAVWQQGMGANREVLAEWLAAAARLELSRRRPEQAARLLGAAEALTEAVGAPLVVPPPSQYRRLVSEIRRELGADAFAAAWTAGRALPEADAVAEALAPSALPKGPLPTALTPREVDILRLLASGMPDREIAAALFVSVRTVEGHVARIFAKLGVRTRTAAARAALAAGLVPPDAPAQSAPPR